MTTKRPVGFAALTPEERERMAGRGGRAAHAIGKGHQWTREEARAAARKSWLNRRKKS